MERNINFTPPSPLSLRRPCLGAFEANKCLCELLTRVACREYGVNPYVMRTTLDGGVEYATAVEDLDYKLQSSVSLHLSKYERNTLNAQIDCEFCEF